MTVFLFIIIVFSLSKTGISHTKTKQPQKNLRLLEKHEFIIQQEKKLDDTPSGITISDKNPGTEGKRQALIDILRQKVWKVKASKVIRYSIFAVTLIYLIITKQSQKKLRLLEKQQFSLT